MKGKSQAFWQALRFLPHGLLGKQWKLSIQFVITTNLKRPCTSLVLVVSIYALTLVALHSTTMIRCLFQHELCFQQLCTCFMFCLPITVKCVIAECMWLWCSKILSDLSDRKRHFQFKCCYVLYFKLVIYAGPNTNSRKVTEYGGNTLGYGSRSVLGTGWPKDLVKVRKISPQTWYAL